MTEGLPIGTYNIIYADPPWRYEQRKVQGAAENHYPTMSIDELCALPVPELAAKDCALFLWATFPQLPEALRLIRAWGFRYKTVAFVWLKRNRKSPSWFYGMGYWTRSNAEICLLATKGKPKRQSAGVHQFIISPIEQHSKKPDEARDKILALMGVPLFFLLKGGIGTTAAAMVMIVVMLPGFLFGVYEKNGQPLEVVGRQIIESCCLRPKERPYQTVNAYDALVCQYQMEQEVKAIVEKSRQRGSKKHGGQAQVHPRRKKTD